MLISVTYNLVTLLVVELEVHAVVDLVVYQRYVVLKRRENDIFIKSKLRTELLVWEFL